MMCARLAKAYTKCDRSIDALAALENGENDARKVLAETPDNSTATAALNLIRQCSEDSHVATGSRL
jgi:hypothetical protein